MALITAALGKFLLNRAAPAATPKSKQQPHTPTAAAPQQASTHPRSPPAAAPYTAAPNTNGLFCVSDRPSTNLLTSLLAKYSGTALRWRPNSGAHNTTSSSSGAHNTTSSSSGAHNTTSSSSGAHSSSVVSSSSALYSTAAQRSVVLTKDDLYLSDYGRGWGPRLTYSVGVAYGTGMLVGVVYGTLLGALHPPAAQRAPTGTTSTRQKIFRNTGDVNSSVRRVPVLYRWAKRNNSVVTGTVTGGAFVGRVVVNSMLNNAAESGAALGNKLGALTILYCTFRSVLSASTSLNETWSVPVAGLLSSTLQSSHGGWRTMLHQGLIGGAAFTLLDHTMKRSMAHTAAAAEDNHSGRRRRRQQMHYY